MTHLMTACCCGRYCVVRQPGN